MNINIFSSCRILLHPLFVLTLCVAFTSLPLKAIAVENITVPDTAYDCLIEPLVIADVGSPTQGIVARLLVDRGTHVKRGQPIVELESSMERALIEQAEARADMQGEVVTREADLALAQLDSTRFMQLHSQNLAPAQQRDEAVAREKVANAALVQALENRQLTLLELKRTQRSLALRTIRSPIDGVVVSQLVFPGELVYDNPVMSVAQLDPLRVEVVLPARLFGTIHSGDTTQIFPELERDEPLVAHVDVVDLLLDSRSGTFGVRLLLPNTDLTIPAGQKCRVSFESSDDSVSLVPASKRENGARPGSAELGAAVPSPNDLTQR